MFRFEVVEEKERVKVNQGEEMTVRFKVKNKSSYEWKAESI